MKFWANLLLSVFVAAYSASSAHAYSKIELDAIANRLAAHEQLQAIFEQERVLKGFAKPFKTRSCSKIACSCSCAASLLAIASSSIFE